MWTDLVVMLAIVWPAPMTSARPLLMPAHAGHRQAAPAPAPPGGPSDHDWEKLLPEDEGKDYVTSLCANCHNLKSIVMARRGSGEWRSVLVTMNARGANLATDDLGIIAKYLVAHFGPNKPAVDFPLDVNKATAEQLGVFPDLSSEDAAKIVAARQARPFATTDDLAAIVGKEKVAGIKPFLVAR